MLQSETFIVTEALLSAVKMHTHGDTLLPRESRVTFLSSHALLRTQQSQYRFVSSDGAKIEFVKGAAACVHSRFRAGLIRHSNILNSVQKQAFCRYL